MEIAVRGIGALPQSLDAPEDLPILEQDAPAIQAVFEGAASAVMENPL